MPPMSKSEKLWATVVFPALLWGLCWTVYCLLETSAGRFTPSDLGRVLVFFAWPPAAIVYGIRAWIRWYRK